MTTEQSTAARSAGARSSRPSTQESSGSAHSKRTWLRERKSRMPWQSGSCARPTTIGQVQLAGRLRLEALDAHLDRRDDAVAELLRGRDEHAELRAVEARDADRRLGARAGEERRAEHDRQLAEVLAGLGAHAPAGARRRCSASAARTSPRAARRRPPPRPRARATGRVERTSAASAATRASVPSSTPSKTGRSRSSWNSITQPPRRRGGT